MTTAPHAPAPPQGPGVQPPFPAPPVEYRYATFLYPSLRGEYIDADDRIFPRDAIGVTAEVKGGIEGVGSDANFLQTHAIGRWYQGIGARNRLIVRAEAGSTWTNALVQMPPSLRFFAGGDRSIRGYGYREVGPFGAYRPDPLSVFMEKRLAPAEAG